MKENIEDPIIINGYEYHFVMGNIQPINEPESIINGINNFFEQLSGFRL